jgi:hypothetical protein
MTTLLHIARIILPLGVLVGAFVYFWLKYIDSGGNKDL